MQLFIKILLDKTYLNPISYLKFKVLAIRWYRKYSLDIIKKNVRLKTVITFGNIFLNAKFYFQENKILF